MKLNEMLLLLYYWIGITLKTNDEFKKEKRIKIIKRIIALVILEGIAVNGNYGAYKKSWKLSIVKIVKKTVESKYF